MLQVNFVPVLKFHAEIAVKWQDKDNNERVACAIKVEEAGIQIKVSD